MFSLDMIFSQWFILVFYSQKPNVHNASNSTNMTYYQARRDHDNAPSDFAGKDSHFFKNILDKTLCDQKLVRILTSLSQFYSKNLMLLMKHRLDWLAACLIWIVLRIYMLITLVCLFMNLENTWLCVFLFHKACISFACKINQRFLICRWFQKRL